MVEMDAHLDRRLLGVLAGDSLHDADVILGALPDQHRTFGGAPSDIQPHIIEAVRDALEDDVAGRVGKLPVKAAIENPESDRIVQDLFVGGNDGIKVGDVRFRCLLRGLADDLDLDDPPAFEGIAEFVSDSERKKSSGAKSVRASRSVTKAPPPWRNSITPSIDSARSASRRVGRLMSRISMSCRSDGSRSPGLSNRVRTRSRIRLTTLWATPCLS